MSHSFELKAYGRVDLDGTHRAVIEADIPRIEELGGGADTDYLRLTHGAHSCGCILSKTVSDGENRIYMDRFKLWHLCLEDGDIVRVEALKPSYCQSVTLRVSSDFSDRDSIRFIGKPITSGEKSALFSFSGESRAVEVKELSPKGIVVVTPTTEIRTAGLQAEDTPIKYKDIGGLSREIKLIREVVEYPFRFPEVFKHLGVSQPKGVILYGPPGTGKTLIAKALATEVGARFFSISGPEIYSKWYGKSEETLRNLFEDAVKNAPSVVVIDELDSLVPKRETTHGDQEQRIVATFLAQMDGLKEMRDVIVVGTTNRINSIDPALRRGGRFEYEVNISVPDANGRLEILHILTKKMPLAPDVSLAQVAMDTNGFVGADLTTLCREAAYNAMRRTFSSVAIDNDVTPTAGLDITHDDFETATSAIPPSGAREFAFETPAVSWGQVGGMNELKRLLTENITYAITKQEAFEKLGVKPAAGILMYGPPGTGKTLLARAVANECQANFISIKGPELRSKWTGEGEEKIRSLFAKARMLAPCVIFFDEIDAAIPRRGRDMTGYSDLLVNQILSEMDGIEGGKGIFVLGATNKIESLDPAVLRPGRFDHLIQVPLPDQSSRLAIFSVHSKDKPLDEDVDLAALAERTKGFSGADIAEICRQAAWSALRESNFEADDTKINGAHFESALETMTIFRNNVPSYDGQKGR